MKGIMFGTLGAPVLASQAHGQRRLGYTRSATQVAAHDLAKVTLSIDRPDAAGPFTDATVEGEFTLEAGPSASTGSAGSGSRGRANSPRQCARLRSWSLDAVRVLEPVAR